MATPSNDSKTRFSNRVDAYVKYRPGYPPGVMELLRIECGLSSNSIIADVGSGTGIFSEMLLKGGSEVFGVEPNAEMRAAADKLLASYPRFKSVDGTGEQTGLLDASVDLVTCAQAFHWLERAKAAEEFRRICRRGGWIAILWNARKTDASPFLAAYDELLLRYGTDYAKVAHEKSPTAQTDLATIFGAPIKRATFANEQRFDLAGLRGRVASSSYTPAPGEPGHHPLFDGLDALFNRFAENDRVIFEYETEVFCLQN